MVYAPQRRHAVASLAYNIHALCLLQHLYSPNALILVARVLAQIQVIGVAYIHPQRSLFTMFLMFTAMSSAAVMLHSIDFTDGMNGGKSLMLDFVGQAHPASFTRVILLDVLLYILQLTSLTVSFINSHPKDLASSPKLPFDDLLLPPPTLSSGTSSAVDEVDLEAGHAKRRRRGTGAMYEPVEGEENELWLNDDEDEAAKGGSSSRHPLLSTRRRIHEPPLIFSLPLPYVIQLVWHLPTPTPPSPAFAGGTPTPTPPITPATEDPPPLSSVAEADDEAEDTEDDEVTDGIGRGSPSARRGRVRGAAGLMPEIGRIPGEYQVGSGRGNGG